ncbi:LmeA family phospholipid-binding protein [Nocardia thailandica]
MRAVLILLAVAVIAVIVGDRVALVTAENEIGRRIAAEYDLAAEPDVGIGGFPFLTQAVAGSYPDVDIRVGDWSGSDLTVHDLDVALTDVSAPLEDVFRRRASNLVATTATATAVVPYDVVRDYAPSGVESISDSPNGLRVTGRFPVAGISVPATVFVTVAVTDAGLEVTPVSAQSTLGGPAIPLTALQRSLTFVVPLRQLPLGARVTAVAPGPDGLHATAVAHDVHLSDLP